MIPSGYVKIAIENGDLWWIYPLKMVIFHSYVSLPQGILWGVITTDVGKTMPQTIPQSSS